MEKYWMEILENKEGEISRYCTVCCITNFYFDSVLFIFVYKHLNLRDILNLNIKYICE